MSFNRPAAMKLKPSPKRKGTDIHRVLFEDIESVLLRFIGQTCQVSQRSVRDPTNFVRPDRSRLNLPHAFSEESKIKILAQPGADGAVTGDVQRGFLRVSAVIQRALDLRAADPVRPGLGPAQSAGRV